MRRLFRRCLFFVIFSFISTIIGVAQQVPAVSASDATAIQIAQYFALQSGVGTTAVTSYSAAGTISRLTTETEESVPVILQGSGFNQSRLDAQFSSGVKTEVRGFDAQSAPVGYWTSESGNHLVPFENVYQGTNWYFPLLSSLGQFADPTLTFRFVGQETWNETNVLHVRVFQQLSPATKRTPAVVISTEYYVDPQTYLLLGMSGTLHPDNGSSSEIAWEVRYSQYVKTAGVMAPMHIDEYLNGTRIRSIAISSIQINPALAASTFQAR